MTPASDEETSVPVVPLRARRAARMAGVGLLTIAVVIGGVWVERKPIAEHFVDSTLAAKGVAASYHIEDLAIGGQRLTNLVIGDPAHPDLVADWVEIHTAIGFDGPRVTGIEAGHVRLKGQLVNGQLSLGAINRLLPAPSGKPFALPHLDVSVDDARMRLRTPQGIIGVKLSGEGMLDDGFKGRLFAVSSRLTVGQCFADRVAAAGAIQIRGAQPHLKGPVRAALLDCGETRARGVVADLDASLGARLDRWQGTAAVSLASLDAVTAKLAKLGGTVSFDGSARRTNGEIDVAAAQVVGGGIRASKLRVKGAYRIEPPFLGFQGHASMGHAALDKAMLTRLDAFGKSAHGTPFGPLAEQLAKASADAARSLAVDADVLAMRSARGGRIGVSSLVLNSANGAHASLSAGDGIIYDLPDHGVRIDGLLTVAGGGLPEAAIRLNQPRVGATITGSALVRPYAAGGARLALTPVTFTASPAGTTRFTTTATLSGPIGENGRLENGRLAVDGRWDGHQRLAIDPDCATIGFDRLKVAGLDLGKTQARLCPQDGALIAIRPGQISGGARLGATQLSGKLGSSPLAIALGGGTLALDNAGFALSGVAVLLGPADRQTRLEFATLDGHLAADAITGTFSGGAGHVANVPLLLSDAAGDWRYARDALELTGALAVADAAASPRFNPLKSKDVSLRLADNVITATGTLVTPATGIAVTKVSLAHDLTAGSGHADLAAPGIHFDKTLQPDALTPLTFGVIADVEGVVSGTGHIEWSPKGVESCGTFATKNANFAAAFGPVTGLSTTIHFNDLLDMVSAPDQVATVDEINPGVAVDNGVIHYEVLSPTQLQIDGARWPFSGGELTLDPGVLDFSQGKARRLTFNVSGMDAGQFIQKFDFKNIDATGTFDGTLPMVFDVSGGNIVGGHLTVRPGGGSVAYVGDLTQKDLGTWGNMAFQALKSLHYDSLDIVLNGPLAGEMVTQVKFDGIHQGKGTHANFLVKRLMKLPFVFNVTIRAPFRQLISSAQSLYDPNSLPKDKLKALLDDEKQRSEKTTSSKPAIQPPESEAVR